MMAHVIVKRHGRGMFVLVTRAPARRCPGTRTKAKTLLINSCYTLVVNVQSGLRSLRDPKPLLGVCVFFCQVTCRKKVTLQLITLQSFAKTTPPFSAGQSS